MRAVAACSNRFAVDMYVKLAETEKGNMFFSANSIHTALSMAYAGARGNTRQEMHDVLGFAAPGTTVEASRSPDKALLRIGIGIQ